MRCQSPIWALLWLCLIPATSLAVEPELTPERQFAEAIQALEQGAYTRAIDRYELMADHGFVHPDASFNRALAYVHRAESGQARPGDLGRAAAAFSEALLLRPGDDEAHEGLRLVREEIGRRRAREGAEQVSVSPSLSRALVGLLSESTWAVLAALGSAALSLGLLFRLWLGHGGTRLAGGIMVVLGTLLLAVGSSFALGARHFRNSSRPAIVVASEARLLDASGKPLARGAAGTAAIAEGERVFVIEERSTRAKVEWGTTQGWVNRSQLQILQR